MEQKHLDYLDAIDAFVLRYGHQLTVLDMAQRLGIPCQEVSDRYDSLYFIHVACQTPIDKEYHKRCNKLLKSFPPALQVEGERARKNHKRCNKLLKS